ncbi:MAG: ArnT family glycosyltransferase, partial [Thermoflexus sp.]
MKVWSALPLILVADIPDPRTSPAWEEARLKPSESISLLNVARSVITSYQPIDRLVFPARAMAALLALPLGAIIYRWAADLNGERTGLLALFFLSLDPNILAHSAVVGTDLGAAFTITLTLFLLARWLRRPTTLRLAATGVALGMALGTKTSAVLLLPVILSLGVLACSWHFLRMTAELLGVAGLTLWAIYGFEIARLPGTDIFFPAASHLIPFLRLRQHVTEGHPAFLMGETRLRGWWYYFPVAFALKTPMPILLLLPPCTYLLFRQQLLSMPAITRKWGPVVLFPVLYGISALFSPINIGYRHLLPVLPFVFIIISVAVAYIPLRKLRNGSILISLIWLGIGTLRMTPHYLAYFNELAGGPDNGWRYLADSNTDWG